MKPIDALLDLLGRLGACSSDKVLVNDEELRQWPAAAVKAMKSQKLIKKARPASSAICAGCEYECVMPVHSLTGKEAKVSFIVCDKRSDINRVLVPAGRLIQWQCSVELICDFVAANLGLRRSGRQTSRAGIFEIGIAHGDKRSQMLSLKVNGELVLVAGNAPSPLADLIEYRDGKFWLNDGRICRLVDSATTADTRYTSSDVKREARKRETQEMHDSWRKAYRDLKRKHPDMSDVWCSRRISRMEIAQGRNAETIRKNMRK